MPATASGKKYTTRLCYIARFFTIESPHQMRIADVLHLMFLKRRFIPNVRNRLKASRANRIERPIRICSVDELESCALHRESGSFVRLDGDGILQASCQSWLR